MKIIITKWNVIIFLISIFTLITALIAEYIFNLLPCEMCLKQRYPYYFIIVIFIFFYFINKRYFFWFNILGELALFYGLFYTAWHVGIEQKIFETSPACAFNLDNNSSAENLKQQIINQDIVSCGEISWTIFGLSAATLNLLLIVFLLFFNSIIIYKHFNEKEKTE